MLKKKKNFKNEIAEFKQKALQFFNMFAYICKIIVLGNCHKSPSAYKCPMSIFFFLFMWTIKIILLIELKLLYFQRILDIDNIRNLDRKKPKKLTKDMKGS